MSTSFVKVCKCEKSENDSKTDNYTQYQDNIYNFQLWWEVSLNENSIQISCKKEGFYFAAPVDKDVFMRIVDVSKCGYRPSLRFGSSLNRYDTLEYAVTGCKHETVTVLLNSSKSHELLHSNDIEQLRTALQEALNKNQALSIGRHLNNIDYETLD